MYASRKAKKDIETKKSPTKAYPRSSKSESNFQPIKSLSDVDLLMECLKRRGVTSLAKLETSSSTANAEIGFYDDGEKCYVATRYSTASTQPSELSSSTATEQSNQASAPTDTNITPHVELARSELHSTSSPDSESGRNASSEGQAPVYGPDNPYRISDLARSFQDRSSSEAISLPTQVYSLKVETYRAAVERGAKKRDFVGVNTDVQRFGEGGYQLASANVPAFKALLEAARRDLELAKNAGNPLALKTTSIGVTSAYRSADKQFRQWDQGFLMYLRRYAEKKKKSKQNIKGLIHDQSFIESIDPTKLARFIARSLATPGYSTHQKGDAVDFKQKFDGRRLSTNKGDVQGWDQSWFGPWLRANAHQFGLEVLGQPGQPHYEPWHVSVIKK